MDRNTTVTQFPGNKLPTGTAAIGESSPDVLQLVGERVRSLRAEHGMTRKALASASSVSER